MSGEVLSTGLKLIKQPKLDYSLLSFSAFPTSLSEMRYSHCNNQLATTSRSFALGTNYEIQTRYKLTYLNNSYEALFGVKDNANNLHIGIQFQNNGSHDKAVWVGIGNAANNGWNSYYAEHVVPQDNEYHTLNVKRAGYSLIAKIDDNVILNDVLPSDVTNGDLVKQYSWGTNYSYFYTFSGWIDWLETFIKVNDEIVFGKK